MKEKTKPPNYHKVESCLTCGFALRFFCSKHYMIYRDDHICDDWEVLG